MNIWVIIPSYKEKKYTARVLSKVTKFTSNIVFVDDGSQDGSDIVARKFTPHVLVHQTNLGKGAAMKTGAEYVFSVLNGDAVVYMDGDDQHNAEELPLFFSAIRSGSPIVFGVRKVTSEMPLAKIMGNRFASFLMLVLFGTYIPDIPSGFKAITKQIWKKINWDSTGYEVEAEIAARVAKLHLEPTYIDIETIYHDLDKGMTPLDAAHIARCLVQWRLGL